jgi:hypothetical protein
MLLHSASAPPAALPLSQALPPPFGSVAREVHRRVIAGLLAGDEGAVMRQLLESSRELSPAERPLACWLPCAVGTVERAQAGAPLPAAHAILKFVRENVRVMLAKFPLEARCLWLVPATSIDATAAHLVALHLARRGCLARPWLWSFTPRSGEYLVVETIPTGRGHGRHPHAAGHTSLIAEYQPRPLDEIWSDEAALAHAG